MRDTKDQHNRERSHSPPTSLPLAAPQPGERTRRREEGDNQAPCEPSTDSSQSPQNNNRDNSHCNSPHFLRYRQSDFPARSWEGVVPSFSVQPSGRHSMTTAARFDDRHNNSYTHHQRASQHQRQPNTASCGIVGETLPPPVWHFLNQPPSPPRLRPRRAQQGEQQQQEDNFVPYQQQQIFHLPWHPHPVFAPPAALNWSQRGQGLGQEGLAGGQQNPSSAIIMGNSHPGKDECPQDQQPSEPVGPPSRKCSNLSVLLEQAQQAEGTADGMQDRNEGKGAASTLPSSRNTLSTTASVDSASTASPAPGRGILKRQSAVVPSRSSSDVNAGEKGVPFHPLAARPSNPPPSNPPTIARADVGRGTHDAHPQQPIPMHPMIAPRLPPQNEVPSGRQQQPYQPDVIPPSAAVAGAATALLRPPPMMSMGRSAPTPVLYPPTAVMSSNAHSPPMSLAERVARRSSAGEFGVRSGGSGKSNRSSVRRCMSSRELGNVNPTSGSPYTYMLYQRDVVEATMHQRLVALREETSLHSTPSPVPQSSSEEQPPSSQQQKQQRQPCRLTNEARNRRRAEHNRAVVSDLTEMVTELFMAESKLLSPSSYGVAPVSSQRDEVMENVEQFLSDLPLRYALTVDAPSEVLVHMRLMAAARADDTRAAVHIVNLERSQQHGGSRRGRRVSEARSGRMLRLVTMSCADHDGLLEYITKLLGTGGSRVLDADVMLSNDNIALDRFVVEMNGRLRLDKLQQYIESYLRQAKEIETGPGSERPTSPLEEAGPPVSSPPSSNVVKSASQDVGGIQTRGTAYGPLYFNPPQLTPDSPHDRLHEEMQTAVPLAEVIAFNSTSGPLSSANRLHSSGGGSGRFLLRQSSSHRGSDESTNPHTNQSYDENDHSSSSAVQTSGESGNEEGQSSSSPGGQSPRQQQQPDATPVANGTHPPEVRRRQLVNRDATYLREDQSWGVPPSSTPSTSTTTDDRSDDRPPPSLLTAEQRVIPVIPFEDLMLIEVLGSGRVSTVYRAAWQSSGAAAVSMPPPPPVGSPGGVDASGVSIVALKVATVAPDTGDVSHVEELHREADIAAMLRHNNICELVGVASDPECSCLAYEFCEGGSLLSLLKDPSRYYEYLPIALDIANGMAYLHSRNVIHRDLKPSNILLTKDNRAKIADFGMSVANTGQELTAETGTYRWMAPEVIRHESYSSNADVYSFGIVLWQLITREVPFATMTPVQTAYAVAEGHRPEIPPSTPERLRDIISACWDEDSHKRPSFTYIAMALADYAKMAFNPANVGAQTVKIANEMLANVQGNSTVNVDFSAPVASFPAAPRGQHRLRQPSLPSMNSLGDRVRNDSFQQGNWFFNQGPGSFSSGNIGLEI